MKSTGKKPWHPLNLIRICLNDGDHKYLIQTGNESLDILFRDSPLSDNLFADWFPFIALESDFPGTILLYQANLDGALVEWTLVRKENAFHYENHQFISTVTLPGPQNSFSAPWKRSLLSLDISSLEKIRALINDGYIVNHDKLLLAILRPSRLLAFDDQSVICYSDMSRISLALATEIEASIGPIVYASLGAPPSSLSPTTIAGFPEDIFATCSQRSDSKNRLIRTLCLSQVDRESDVDSGCFRHKHLFSYASADRSWVCHCVEITNCISRSTSTVFLLESGEAGLISGVYISSLDVLITSPHPKNGEIEHGIVISRFIAAVSSFCRDLPSPTSIEDRKTRTCILLALTNSSNLYHLLSNDLYGVFSCFDFLERANVEFSIVVGKGHRLLPASIPLSYFNDLGEAGVVSSGCNLGGAKYQPANMHETPWISADILTLAKAPYCISNEPLARYKELIARVRNIGHGISERDLQSCSLKDKLASLSQQESNLIIFGIRCARRKPVNQLEMLGAAARIAEQSGKATTIIIEGTYLTTESDSEKAFIAEETLFVSKARDLLENTSSAIQLLSFVGMPSQYSTYSAFLGGIIIAPWGAGLARHMFFAEKNYIIHTNTANRLGMTKAYYSWEIPYPPKSISYVANQGSDIDCSASDEVIRLDPSRPNWAIFNDYTVDIEDFSKVLMRMLTARSLSRIDPRSSSPQTPTNLPRFQ